MMRFRVQLSSTKALLFTCRDYSTAKAMAAGCGQPTRIVAVRIHGA